MKKNNTLKGALREDVLKFAKDSYETEPQYLWRSSPRYAVLRHLDNKKWYAIIMDVPKNKLGLTSDEIVDILDIKCDPNMIGSLLMQKGFLPAYHMNRENWITILLDGSVDKNQVYSLIEMSFDITGRKQVRKQSKRDENMEWIVPVNPKYFDLEKAFDENDVILWKQSNHILVGDIVYLYVAAPYSAILYKCQAVEVNIAYDYNNGTLNIKKAMRIKRLQKYDGQHICLEKLKEHGVYAVRGPRNMPYSLSHEIKNL